MNKKICRHDMTLGISEQEILDFVEVLSRVEAAIPSKQIREAVLDSIAFDLNLAVNSIRSNHFRNSDLLKLISYAAEKEGLDIITYVREAVVAARDLALSEAYLREIIEQSSLSSSFWKNQEASYLAQDDRETVKQESIPADILNLELGAPRA